MKIYIASSWKNQHGVEMLTALLREKGYEVISWIENNFGELESIKEMSFDEWVWTERADRCFKFDTDGAMNCDLLIYYGPAGQDASAEAALAFAKGIPVLGLHAKGENLGLMRKMMKSWSINIPDLLTQVEMYDPNPFACFGRRPMRMDFDDQFEFEQRLCQYDEFEDQRKHKAV